MRTLTVDEVEQVSGSLRESDVWYAGAGITGAGALFYGAAALLAPEFAIPAAIYGLV